MNFIKKILALFTLILLLPASLALAFTDVSSSDPHNDAIQYLQGKGVIQGYSDGTFRPDSPINRAEFLKILLEAKTPGTAVAQNQTYCFPDVADAWYAPYVCYAKSQAIVNGYPDGNFHPENNINLAEALKMVLETYVVEVNTGAYSQWYEAYYWTAEPNGWLNNINHDINHLVTRGEMAEFVWEVEGNLPIDQKTPSNLNSSTSIDKNGLCYDQDCIDKDPDYVIITRPLFIETIQAFIQWKTKANFKVGIFTLEYINTLKNKENPVENIRELIKDYSIEHDTKYFLLIGDTTSGNKESYGEITMESVENMYKTDYSWNIPTGNLCIDASDCEHNWQGTDLYYADFDDEPWVKLSGGYYFGQVTVNGSEVTSPPLDFETIVARIPIREQKEFENIFNKMKNYQTVTAYDIYSSMIEEPFLKPGCITEEFEDYEDAALHGPEGCRNNTGINKDLLERNGIFYNFQYIDLLDESESRYNESLLTLGKELLLKEKNLAYPNYHGGLEAIEVLDKSDVELFENIFPAWIVESCDISNFSNPRAESMSEALIKAEKGPAFVLRLPNEYAFLKASIEGKTVGEAFYNVNEIILMVRSGNNILFGDPSLKIF